MRKVKMMEVAKISVMVVLMFTLCRTITVKVATVASSRGTALKIL
jgi:hypothetical protein